MNAPHEPAGDWILNVDIVWQDRLLARLNGICATRELALAALPDSLGRMDWGNMLDVHGQPLSDRPDFFFINDARMHFSLGPRALR